MTRAGGGKGRAAEGTGKFLTEGNSLEDHAVRQRVLTPPAGLASAVLVAPAPSPALWPDDQALVVQLREVNERLVLAMLRAQQLGEEADDARAAVSLSERRFRSLVQTIAAVVWTADARGWVRLDPEPWRLLTGLESSLIPGEWDWLAAVHIADRERVRAAWVEAVAAGTEHRCDYRLILRDGRTAWVHARAVRVDGGQGEWMGMLADITDRKVVEDARVRFIGVLGHDLRTPLTAIDMSASHLASLDSLPPAQQRVVDIIVRSSGRMRRMIDDVLDFARGRLGGGIPVTLASADFGAICAEAVRELVAVHPGRTIVLETTGELTGSWDADRVEQVVSNLVGNALEHGIDPVRVTVRGDADDVLLEVNNQNLGAPISPLLLPLLFEPFRRGERELSAGLGLGLYIASEIVLAHGATISATSSLAGGTTFTSRWSRHLLEPAAATLAARQWFSRK